MQMDDEARQLVRRMALALHPFARAALDAQAATMKGDPPADARLDPDGETAFGLILAATAALTGTADPAR